MLWLFRFQANDRDTDAAAAQRSSPVCEAVIEQVIFVPVAPGSDFTANEPLAWVSTEHVVGVVDVKVTARPEVAVAVRGLRAPTSRLERLAKLIDCGAAAPGCGVVIPLIAEVTAKEDESQYP